MRQGCGRSCRAEIGLGSRSGAYSHRKFADSPLEGDGFEPSVPHKKQPFLAARARSRKLRETDFSRQRDLMRHRPHFGASRPRCAATAACLPARDRDIAEGGDPLRKFSGQSEVGGLVQPPDFRPPVVLPAGSAPQVAYVWKTEEKGSDVNLGVHLCAMPFGRNSTSRRC
jgi:hypothetical protein